jgi:hypothetical protein
VKGGGRYETARRDRRSSRNEAGVALVEVLVASLILTITFVSLASVLIRSISTGHLAQQREAAASLVSDVIENGRALGLDCLTAASVSPSTSATVLAAIAACPTVLLTPGTQPGTWTGLQPPATSLVQSAAFFSPAPVTIDATVYTLTVTLAGTAPSPVTLTAKAAWSSASYTSSAIVGY